MTTLVLLSDTHGFGDELDVPPGDVLVHAGDMTGAGSLEEIAEVNRWLGTLPHRHKVVIAGNHDFSFERTPGEARALITNAIYLQDEAVVLDGIRFYGSPWQPWFFDWAFNLVRGPELADKWAKIPEDTDVLITHGPPAGILDTTYGGEHAGCADLLERVRTIRPRLHVFGHIHEAAGTHEEGDTTFVNASISRSRGTSPVTYEFKRRSS